VEGSAVPWTFLRMGKVLGFAAGVPVATTVGGLAFAAAAFTGVGLPAVAFIAVAPAAVAGQDVTGEARGAYFRAVAEHFGVSPQEVAIVGDWDLEPDEVPVVLFLARRAGVSPDVLVGLRRGGRSWMDLSDRFGLDARTFHLALPDGAPLGVLTRAFGEFRGRPARDWSLIRLTDPEVVALVNLRVLSAQVGTPPVTILRSREEAGSFVGAYLRLRGG
jgi:hypothetical protein